MNEACHKLRDNLSQHQKSGGKIVSLGDCINRFEDPNSLSLENEAIFATSLGFASTP